MIPVCSSIDDVAMLKCDCFFQILSFVKVPLPLQLRNTSMRCEDDLAVTSVTPLLARLIQLTWLARWVSPSSLGVPCASLLKLCA